MGKITPLLIMTAASKTELIKGDGHGQQQKPLRAPHLCLKMTSLCAAPACLLPNAMAFIIRITHCLDKLASLRLSRKTNLHSAAFTLQNISVFVVATDITANIYLKKHF